MELAAPRILSALDRKPTSKRGRTRTLVVAAAIDCIREKGIDAATASEIAQRCDLSWGVIQYHFGDRAGLLLAILEGAFDTLRDSVMNLHFDRADVRTRVESLVDSTWSLLRHDDYRVMLEIQLQLARDPDRASLTTERADEMRRKLQEAWISALPECDPRLVKDAERLATVSLRGLALERAVEPERTLEASMRHTIVTALLSILNRQPK